MIFHRRESPTQTAAVAEMQELSLEVWGGPPRYSDIPTVEAYRGRLPKAARGVEFDTDVAPDKWPPPHIANWRGPRKGVRVEADFAKIKVKWLRNRQK